jgi:hypothetical protein
MQEEDFNIFNNTSNVISIDPMRSYWHHKERGIKVYRNIKVAEIEVWARISIDYQLQ